MKSFKQAWELYESVQRTDLPMDQRLALRKAFYVGGLATMGSIMENLHRGDSHTLRLALAKEIMEFFTADMRPDWFKR